MLSTLQDLVASAQLQRRYSTLGQGCNDVGGTGENEVEGEIC